jgi:ABC-type dipeptide/oligopeptide/nickel transport system ATPase component
LSVAPGSVLGVVGESGSGKSSIGYALMRLTDASRATLGGALTFEGRDLLALSGRDWRKLRGNRIAMVFQDAMATLNPVMRVGDQIGEVFRFHRPDMSRRAIRSASLDLLERVGIQEASRRIDAYPHQLSGGMRQRVVIAAAIALKPALLIADEPTTALDVTVQAQILRLMQELSREQGTAMILISHDLDVVSDVCEDVVVMKDGVIVEAGPVDDVLSRPRHAYTLQLLNARPSFGAGHMQGEVSHG